MAASREAVPGTLNAASFGVGGLFVVGALLSIFIAANTHDNVMAFHAAIFVLFFVLGIFAIGKRHFDTLERGPEPTSQDGITYHDGPIRVATIAALFWGIAGFLAGLYIALELAFPWLNFDLAFLNFGRLRPLHTSAVIFAFGGNALIATSLYVVQRTCKTRIAGDIAPWFIVWGYQLFIVLAATGYLLGVTQGKEYAEPEWYVDLWLTIVWVVYLIVFLATLAKRKEPHIYVANWFYLAFIVTIAMLHLVNNAAIPVSLTSAKSYILWSGVQDALIQWWYGHNAVGFFLTAGFLGMMYYFVPKRAERPVFSYRLSIVRTIFITRRYLIGRRHWA